MSRALETCAFLVRKALPWALALSVPVACASSNDAGSGEQAGVQGPAVGAAAENVGEVTQALTNGTVSTDANLKVAFVGDTADGTNWKNVLQLAKDEGAAAVVTAGDMTYD